MRKEIKNGVKWFMPINSFGYPQEIYPTKKMAKEEFKKIGLKCEGFIVLQEIREDSE